MLECFSKFISQIVEGCAARCTSSKEVKGSEESQERMFRASLATRLHSAIESFHTFVSPYAVTKTAVTNRVQEGGSPVFSGHVIGVGVNSIGPVDCAFRRVFADDKTPALNKLQGQCCSRSLGSVGVLGKRGLVGRAMVITGDIIIDGEHKHQLFVGCVEVPVCSVCFCVQFDVKICYTSVSVVHHSQTQR